MNNKVKDFVLKPLFGGAAAAYAIHVLTQDTFLGVSFGASMALSQIYYASAKAADELKIDEGRAKLPPVNDPNGTGALFDVP